VSRREEGTQGFRPVSHVTEPITPVARALARTGYLIFRGADGFEVAIPAQVVERMLAFGRAAAPLEWFGLVVGRVGEDERGRHVVVLGVVPDPEARAERHFVQSTVASEFETRTSARTLYPDGIVVGWVHGHVRQGAQYSSTDRENQTSWGQTHSLGVVVDPWDPKRVAVYRGPRSELLTLVEGGGESAVRSPPSGVDTGPRAPQGGRAHEAPRLLLGPDATRRLLWGFARLGFDVLTVLCMVLALRLYTSERVFSLRLNSAERRLEHVELESLRHRFRLDHPMSAPEAPCDAGMEEDASTAPDAGPGDVPHADIVVDVAPTRRERPRRASSRRPP
jgi:proteasome lid subunit RPN8/RPN11